LNISLSAAAVLAGRYPQTPVAWVAAVLVGLEMGLSIYLRHRRLRLATAVSHRDRKVTAAMEGKVLLAPLSFQKVAVAAALTGIPVQAVARAAAAAAGRQAVEALAVPVSAHVEMQEGQAQVHRPQTYVLVVAVVALAPLVRMLHPT